LAEGGEKKDIAQSTPHPYIFVLTTPVFLKRGAVQRFEEKNKEVKKGEGGRGEKRHAKRFVFAPQLAW